MTQDPDGDRSLAGEIMQSLARRIVDGELEPGRRLRQEHVAAEFQTSHVPVREAFRRLEAGGLIVNQPRRGVRVAPLEPAGVLELSQMRAALEALALRHAIGRMSKADLAVAERALREGAASGRIEVWEDAN